MSIGYACLAIGVKDTTMKSCIEKNATKERLGEIISWNLKALEHLIDYNIKHGIGLFRISSDLIPFGSSPVNQISWWREYKEEFQQIGKKIKESGMRVSMHPGQYTVLNSPKEEVVRRAVEDLSYHCRVLDAMDLERHHKIVLHIGGVYQDKVSAIQRFMSNYEKLEEIIKQRLILENDDRSYNIEEVLEIGEKLGAPVVFDNLHNKVNPAPNEKEEVEWILRCKNTWKDQDGRQKIHYSQQDDTKPKGAHSTTIKLKMFLEFYRSVSGDQLDIMLEVKDKNLSALKCKNGTTSQKKIIRLEEEWSKYKYSVLEKSQSDYQRIRQLLKDKNTYPVENFYEIVENALEKEEVVGEEINGAQHVFGYFKQEATESEKKKFFKEIQLYEKGEISIKKVKQHLWKMTVKYQQEYLLNSYYFIFN